MNLGKHPPKPRLAIRVGISGHRDIGAVETTRIVTDLGAVFGVLDRTAAELMQHYSAYFDARGPLKRLLSPLAQGADTLAAQVAERHGYSVQAPLPFSIEDYARDFNEAEKSALAHQLKTTDSVFELNGQRDGARAEESAYLASGYLTLRHCDVLIAIWDGKAARGIGGTAMIVEAAVQRGVPVIWIHAESPVAPCILRDDLLCGPPIEDVRGLLWQTLAPPFEPGESASEDSLNDNSRRSANEFYRERERRTNYGLLHQVFQGLVTGQPVRHLSPRHRGYAQNTDRDWKSFTDNVGAQNPKALERIVATLSPRFSWADGLANHYAAIYRSSYVLNYLLSAGAVLFALIGLFDVSHELWVNIEILEVVAIIVILIVTFNGARRRWHERWIDYRQLAEQLRHLRFLYLTGGTSSNMTPRHNYESGSSEGGWAQWYCQATARELGLAPARASQDYLNLIKRLVLDEEITDQIRYHRGNAHRMHAMEHSLHKFGNLLFAATLVICASYWVLIVIPAMIDPALHDEAGKSDPATLVRRDFKHWVTFFSAFLPALGAAISGIRVQGEFGSAAERSQAMATRLTQLQKEIEADDKAAPVELARLRSFIETTSETMLIEVVDWKFVFRGKPLSLPA